MVVGLATGEAQLVQDKPVAGVHEYVVAPVAVSVVLEPVQIAVFAPALTVGRLVTVTVT